MKYETKYKILQFVKKLIRYPEFDHAPYIIKHEEKIEIIRVKITMPVREEVMMTKKQIEYTVSAGIVSELNKGKFIKYDRTPLVPIYNEDIVQIEGSLRVIQP